MLRLEPAKKTLEKTVQILEELGITYWIDSGTLLSAHRDGTINLLDHDIDIRVFEDEISDDLTLDIIKGFWKAGYRYIVDDKPIKAQILCLNWDDITLDFKLCHRDKEHLWYYCWKEPDPQPIVHVYPIKFFKKLGEIELYGKKYPCPQPVEDYIIHHYGKEWRDFKCRPEQAEDDDVTWDYMKSPPCAKTLGQFYAMKKVHLYDPYFDSLSRRKT